LGNAVGLPIGQAKLKPLIKLTPLTYACADVQWRNWRRTKGIDDELPRNIHAEILYSDALELCYCQTCPRTLLWSPNMREQIVFGRVPESDFLSVNFCPKCANFKPKKSHFGKVQKKNLNFEHPYFFVGKFAIFCRKIATFYSAF